MNPLQIAVPIFALIAAGAVGWFLGGRATELKIRVAFDQERKQAIQALRAAVASVERLHVESQPSAGDPSASESSRTDDLISDLDSRRDDRTTQEELLNRISEVIETNKRTIDNLVRAQSRLQQQTQELDRSRWEARTDPLSGLSNRKAFDEALENQLAELRRNQTSFALLLLDVDHFKSVNDNHGHPIGDQLITQLGKALLATVRSRDFVGRYGGDEFAILFSSLPRDKAWDVARRIQASIQHSGFDCIDGTAELNVTLSMGLATAQPGDTSESILSRSDEALYRAKHLGRNQLVVWTANAAEAPGSKSDRP